MGQILGLGALQTSGGLNKLVAVKGAKAFILGTGTPRSPQTLASDNSTGTIAWSGPSLASSHNADPAVATLAANGISEYLKATNFGFGIPSTATINGIKVEILKFEADDSSANVFDNRVRIVKSGSIGSTDRADSAEWQLGINTGGHLEDHIYTTYGSETDLWGETWTPANINASTFGVAISAKAVSGTVNSQAQIDHIRITVYYTPVTAIWESQPGNGGGFTEGSKVQFEPFLDKLYAVNYQDHNRYYTGYEWLADDPTNVGFKTDVLRSPKASYLKPFNVRMYLADIVLPVVSQTERSWIWFSDLPKDNKLTWGLEARTNLVTTASSAVVTSSGAKFITRNIKVGDPFVIKDRGSSANSLANIGEYVVASVDSETQITLTKTLGYTATGQSFWVGGNFLNYKTDDSDYIRGLGENSEKLLIFKLNSLGKSNGTDEIKNVKAAPGTLSQRSVVNLREYTYYHHPSAGILRYNGVSSEIISNPIWDYMKGVDPSHYDDIVGWTEDERYVKFTLGDVTNNDVELSRPDCVAVLDTLDNQWSFESKGLLFNATTKFTESNSINTYGGAEDGNVYQLDTGNSWDGDDIPFDASFGPIFPISPEVEVDFTRILAFANPSLGLRIRYKLYYKPDGRIDLDWHEFSHNQTNFGGNQRIELFFPEHSRACGVEFLIEESGQTPSFLWERVSIFYKNASIVSNTDQKQSK